MMTVSATAPPDARRRPLSSRQWCVVVVLAGVAGSLLTAWAQSAPRAVAQPTVGDGGGRITAVAGPVTSTTHGLYLVDTERRALLVYEIVPGGRDGRVLHLRAARTLLFDTQLESYNTEPDPAEIAEMVRQARRIGQ